VLCRVVSFDVDPDGLNPFARYVDVVTDVNGNALPRRPIRAAIAVAAAVDHDVDPGASPTGLGTDGAVWSVGFIADGDDVSALSGTNPNSADVNRFCVTGLSRDEGHDATGDTKARRNQIQGVEVYLHNPDDEQWDGGGSSLLEGYAFTCSAELNPVGSAFGTATGRLRVHYKGGISDGSGGTRPVRVTYHLFYGDSYVGTDPTDPTTEHDIKAVAGVTTTGSGTKFVPTSNAWAQSEDLFNPTHVFVVSANGSGGAVGWAPAWVASGTGEAERASGNPFSDAVYGSWQIDAMLSIGISQNDIDGEAVNRSHTWADAGDEGTTKTSAHMSETYALFSEISSSAALTGAAKIECVQNGFNVVQDGTGDEDYDFLYLALDLGEFGSSFLWTYSTESGTGDTELKIPVPAVGSDPGWLVHPSAIIALQGQTTYGQIGGSQTAATSATMGLGLGANNEQTWTRRLFLTDGGKLYGYAGSAHQDEGEPGVDGPFASYEWSKGDFVQILGAVNSSDEAEVNSYLGKWFIDSKANDEEIYLVDAAGSPPDDPSGILPLVVSVFQKGLELAKGQRSIGWQSEDNQSTADTQASVYDELGYLLKKHGTPTYDTNTVTRFEWAPHDSAGSVPHTWDANLYYHSSKLNARQWPMLAFQMERQRIPVTSTSSSVESVTPGAIYQYPEQKVYIGRSVNVGVEHGYKGESAHLNRQKVTPNPVSFWVSVKTKPESRYYIELPAAVTTRVAPSLVETRYHIELEAAVPIGVTQPNVGFTIGLTLQKLILASDRTGFQVVAPDVSKVTLLHQWIYASRGVQTFVEANDAVKAGTTRQFISQDHAVPVATAGVTCVVPNYGPIRLTELPEITVTAITPESRYQLLPPAVAVPMIAVDNRATATEQYANPAAVPISCEAVPPFEILLKKQTITATVATAGSVAITPAITRTKQTEVVAAATSRALSLTPATITATKTTFTAAAVVSRTLAPSVTSNIFAYQSKTVTAATLPVFANNVDAETTSRTLYIVAAASQVSAPPAAVADTLQTLSPTAVESRTLPGVPVAELRPVLTALPAAVVSAVLPGSPVVSDTGQAIAPVACAIRVLPGYASASRTGQKIHPVAAGVAVLPGAPVVTHLDIGRPSVDAVNAAVLPGEPAVNLVTVTQRSVSSVESRVLTSDPTARANRQKTYPLVVAVPTLSTSPAVNRVIVQTITVAAAVASPVLGLAPQRVEATKQTSEVTSVSVAVLGPIPATDIREYQQVSATTATARVMPASSLVARLTKETREPTSTSVAVLPGAGDVEVRLLQQDVSVTSTAIGVTGNHAYILRGTLAVVTPTLSGVAAPSPVIRTTKQTVSVTGAAFSLSSGEQQARLVGAPQSTTVTAARSRVLGLAPQKVTRLHQVVEVIAAAPTRLLGQSPQRVTHLHQTVEVVRAVAFLVQSSAIGIGTLLNQSIAAVVAGVTVRPTSPVVKADRQTFTAVAVIIAVRAGAAAQSRKQTQTVTAVSAIVRAGSPTVKDSKQTTVVSGAQSRVVPGDASIVDREQEVSVAAVASRVLPGDASIRQLEQTLYATVAGTRVFAQAPSFRGFRQTRVVTSAQFRCIGLSTATVTLLTQTVEVSSAASRTLAVAPQSVHRRLTVFATSARTNVEPVQATLTTSKRSYTVSAGSSRVLAPATTVKGLTSVITPLSAQVLTAARNAEVLFTQVDDSGLNRAVPLSVVAPQLKFKSHQAPLQSMTAAPLAADALQVAASMSVESGAIAASFVTNHAAGRARVYPTAAHWICTALSTSRQV